MTASGTTDGWPVRVLVVDDQAMFRRAAAALVRSIDGFELVGVVSSAEQAVEAADELVPGLVLMDVRLPGMDGVEATRRILSARPETLILLVSTYEAADLPSGLADCGAKAFVRKQDLDAQVLLSLGRS